MKPQQLAKLLNVTPATVRRWARDEYTEFLSPSAQGGDGLHRSFGDRDARILAWVAAMRAQNKPPTDILLTLRSAQADHWRNLPPLPGGMANDEPVALMPVETAEERVNAIRQWYELKMQNLTEERDKLRADLDSERAENALLRKKLMEVTDQLLDLNKQFMTLLLNERRRD